MLSLVCDANLLNVSFIVYMAYLLNVVQSLAFIESNKSGLRPEY